MDDELYRLYKLKSQIKNKKKSTEKKKSTSLTKFFSRLLITIILTLVTLILLKQNSSFKTAFYKQIYDNNISFAAINKTYLKYFGSPLPFEDFFLKETSLVFNEKLEYTSQSKYKDGVSLTVSNNYLVPILETGIVIFVGEKEGYGKTVIIEQTDGLEVWYSNLDTINLKLYDYVNKGNLLGEADGDKLYLVYKKNGKVLEYEKYI